MFRQQPGTGPKLSQSQSIEPGLKTNNHPKLIYNQFFASCFSAFFFLSSPLQLLSTRLILLHLDIFEDLTVLCFLPSGVTRQLGELNKSSARLVIRSLHQGEYNWLKVVCYAQIIDSGVLHYVSHYYKDTRGNRKYGCHR